MNKILFNSTIDNLIGMKMQSPQRLPQGSERFDVIDRLVDLCRNQNTLNVNILIDDTFHSIDWPVDFSEYETPQRPRPSPQQLFRNGDYLDPESVQLIGKYLHACDFDTLTYYTIGPAEFLQNTQNRNDWFFYIDYFLDSQRSSLADSAAAVSDMIAWTYDRRHQSQFRWVNNANAMLLHVLEELEESQIDTALIIENTRYYYEGLLHENDSAMTLQSYLENRAKSCGMYPEVEYCFSYTRDRIKPAEFGHAFMMKSFASALVALQNDTCSLWKERSEKDKINLMTYCQVPGQFIDFVTRTYGFIFRAFHGIKPQPGERALMQYWNVCNRWICGSLVWHLTTKRYNRGNIVFPR